MRKLAACLMMIVFVSALLGGCWNYRSLSDVSITSGIAVDRDPESGIYHLSFEIVDLTGPVMKEGIKSRLIESDGRTLFDAVRNVKKRIVNKVFFGHMELVVFSDELMRNADISSLIDFFLRDAECRETMCVAVSKEPKAKDLLVIQGIGEPMVAYEIRSIIEEDHNVTGSTTFVELYEVYNTLKGQGKELVLPAFRNTVNDGEPASEADGIAVFKGERLAGYLTPEESKYFLFVVNQLKGGVLTCSSKGSGESEDITLEISDNQTTLSFDNDGEQITINVETETDTYLNEIDQPMDALDPAAIQAVELIAAQKVMQGIYNMIIRVRADYNSDIFGFGNLIYRQKPKLWETMADRWDQIFPELAINVKCKVNIVNTASLKTS